MNEIIPPARPQRAMMIKGLTPSLPERGKIKIGVKGKAITSKSGNEFQPPQKLDHFVVTTLVRGQDGNFVKDEAIHKALGDKPTEIPVRLLYDDPMLNFPTRLACYKGRTLWCSGDGEKAQRLNEDGKGHHECQCPCQLSDPAYQGKDKCKMNGSLSALIDGAGGLGGVWKFRTTSYNTIVGLLSSMSFLRSITGGPLANIPLGLTLTPKIGTTPNGESVNIFVVGLTFKGDTTDLQQIGHRIALDRATTHMSIERIEDEARRLLLAAPLDTPLPGDITDDVVDEFYPDQAVVSTVAPPRPTLDQYKASTAKATPIEVPQDADPYAIIDDDGEIKEFTDHNAAAKHLCQLLSAASKANNPSAFDGIFESNEGFRAALVKVDPKASLALGDYCGDLRDKFAPDEPDAREVWTNAKIAWLNEQTDAETVKAMLTADKALINGLPPEFRAPFDKALADAKARIQKADQLTEGARG